MRLLAALGVFAALTASALGAASKEPKKSIVPAVQARAKRIAVQLRDLPGSGWKAAPAQSDRSSPHCSYYDPDQSNLTEDADYTSPDFTRADGMYVSSSVGIFVSASQAQTAFGLVVRPELARCLGESVARSEKAGHIDLRSAGKLAFAHYGDRSAAYRIVFLVKAGESFVPATIDLVAIDEGRVDVALFFSSAGQPIPPGLERSVTRAVADRMSK